MEYDTDRVCISKRPTLLCKEYFVGAKVNWKSAVVPVNGDRELDICL